jgi:rare lipoprotein A
LKVFALALAGWCGAAFADVTEPPALAACSLVSELASEPEDVIVSEALTDEASETFLQGGIASWYGGQQWQGRRTASGERFDRQALTAAHKTLPFGSRVRVVNLSNGRAVTVRINDRGPFTPHSIIDLSEAAAKSLGMLQKGRARVALYSGVSVQKQAR